jgi:CRISPR-associated protein Csx1
MVERVLIAPWGNPIQWEPITYEFGNYRMKSSSTLPILIESLRPERVIIFVLDTLANIKIKGKSNMEAKKFSSYSDVVKDVESRVRWFLENELAADCPNLMGMINSGKLKIVVVPGVGLFKNIKIEGDILDFYNYSLYELSRELPTSNMEIYLDLTHGINFMPTLLYRALNNLLGLAAFVNDCKFIVLNSEPYPQGFSKEEKETVVSETILRIRVVEDRLVRPKPIYSEVEDAKLSAFISSLINGFPLVFTTFYPRLNDLKASIDNELKRFFENIEVKNGSVKRNESFSKDFKTLSKLCYLVRCFDSSHELFRDLPRNEVSMDVLEDLIERVFKKIARLEIITKRDVRLISGVVRRANKKEGEIKERLRNGERLLYLDIYNFAEDKNFVRNEKIDPRNFIAHSGLISDRIHVRIDGEKVLLSYEGLEEIAGLSIKSMWGRRNG